MRYQLDLTLRHAEGALAWAGDGPAPGEVARVWEAP